MYYEISFKSTTVIFSWLEVAFCRDIPKVKNPGIWGFSEFSTRDFFGIFKSWSWFPGFWGLFRDFFGIFKSLTPGFRDFWDFALGIFRDFQILIPIPGVLKFWGFFRDFLGIFKSGFRFPGFRDFWDFALGIFSGFLRGFKIPILAILGFSWLRDEILPGFGIWDPKKSHPEAKSGFLTVITVS